MASMTPMSTGTPTMIVSRAQKRSRHGSIGSYPRSALELEREVEQLLRVPVDRTEVGVRRDLADLVADVLGHERGLRVVEHDAILLVDQTLAYVDLGQDRFHAERPDVVHERLVLGVEDLPLPGEEIDHLRDVHRLRRPRIDDGGSLRLAVRNGPGRAVGKELLDLGL